MKDVRLTINRFGGSSSVYIDGMVVDADSGIYDALKNPPAEMISSLFSELHRECFDDYRLTIVTDPAMYEVISTYENKSVYCKSIIADKAPVEPSYSERCKKIKEMWGEHLDAVEVCINVYMNSRLKDNPSVMGIMKTLKRRIESSYYLVKVTMKGASYDRYSDDDDNFSIILVEDEESITEVKSFIEDATDRINRNTVCICISDVTKVSWMDKGILTCKTPKGKIGRALRNAFELVMMQRVYYSICRQIYDKGRTKKIKINKKSQEMFKYLQSLEGILKVECPVRELDLGEECNLNIISIPSKETIPEVEFMYSVNGIVECNNGVVRAINVGETDVLVYVKGDRKPLDKIHFTVKYVSHINEIIALNPILSMKVGERIPLKYDIVPADATDKKNIKTGTKGNSATLERGNIISANKAGNTVIVMKAPSGAMAKWKITVRDKVREISLTNPDTGVELTNINCVTSNIIKIKVQLKPESAWNATLKYCIEEKSDSDVSILEDRSTSREICNGDIITLKAKSFGSAIVKVWSNTEKGAKDLIKQCRIVVESGINSEKYEISWLSVGMVIVFVAILVLMCLR